ncbi:uncharacterized protein I303_103989 [Kwoniella dejecticola CBS 10117]|uniref:Uncharacterized protein n=1 Tax=Kwoniella dejecticola CBS 10117 TaxID=1296121 RepID=A0A1A6A893_9TREE|nr:uncharacterized protein I303_04006 [Kwoniella dejecticola CBS 10117]OBR86284.1 hypothetical protein I303_04006 [Kwoniella dejecticola CBS 10117]
MNLGDDNNQQDTGGTGHPDRYDPWESAAYADTRFSEDIMFSPTEENDDEDDILAEFHQQQTQHGNEMETGGSQEALSWTEIVRRRKENGQHVPIEFQNMADQEQVALQASASRSTDTSQHEGLQQGQAQTRRVTFGEPASGAHSSGGIATHTQEQNGSSQNRDRQRRGQHGGERGRDRVQSTHRTR